MAVFPALGRASWVLPTRFPVVGVGGGVFSSWIEEFAVSQTTHSNKHWKYTERTMAFLSTPLKKTVSRFWRRLEFYPNFSQRREKGAPARPGRVQGLGQEGGGARPGQRHQEGLRSAPYPHPCPTTVRRSGPSGRICGSCPSLLRNLRSPRVSVIPAVVN